MNKIDLKDKEAVVTGGVQGFGLAIVEKLLESYAELIIWDVEELASIIAWMISEENSFTTTAVFDLIGGRASY